MVGLLDKKLHDDFARKISGGPEGTRTLDIRLRRLSQIMFLRPIQLGYGPIF